ncbi:hypothetical protein MLD38_036981 [Melastoma candidum]|uniref:Uncharacterized protein n=1 Tax=Melastoma candidum TaxID=119954 RepID=A0ACB9LLB0_9MYRT|nr:hypothetical protein MLD38_036981 [Melastoma candidum]
MNQSLEGSFISSRGGGGSSSSDDANKKPPLSLSLCYHNLERFVLDGLSVLPTSVLALLLLLLLSYNVLVMFSVDVDVSFSDVQLMSLPVAEKQGISPVQGEPESSSTQSSSCSSSGVMCAVKEDDPPDVSEMPPEVLQRVEKFGPPIAESYLRKPRRSRKRRGGRVQGMSFGTQPRVFASRVHSFFQNQTCSVRIFMTWISSAESFGDREVFALESLFRSHRDACLVIISSSLDTELGKRIINPFLDKAYRVICVSPNFEYLFRDTHAETWFRKLIDGKVRPGEVSLGQNLSNLLRLVLLYKFGGIYLDFDMIALRSFIGLRNVIGAQTMDVETRNWTRLNNAVLIFDKNHPLLFQFIQEFALTFNGNKWGHNGPYLVSRVVSRVIGKPGYDFSILPPSAFYPVDWTRVQSMFKSATSRAHSEWLYRKYGRILKESYGVHLWNKHSRNITIERGSIVDLLMSKFCIFYQPPVYPNCIGFVWLAHALLHWE